jgi:hypothetical protein
MPLTAAGAIGSITIPRIRGALLPGGLEAFGVVVAALVGILERPGQPEERVEAPTQGLVLPIEHDKRVGCHETDHLSLSY